MHVHALQRSTLKCLEMSDPGVTLHNSENEEKLQMDRAATGTNEEGSL